MNYYSDIYYIIGILFISIISFITGFFISESIHTTDDEENDN